MKRYLGALFVMATLFGIGEVEAQSSVEDGLDQLASAIVEKSTAADRTTIAILPFANADGSCSVLSSYVVDELTLRLFSVPDSNLEIIERSQLEALVAELKIGGSGLLNPETTKKLGNLSGVSALALGTITIIGDQVRINARLVATDTGATISAAAVNVPKTSTIDSLLAQPVTTGLMCGARSAESQESGSSAGSPQHSADSGLAVSRAGLKFELASVSRSADGARVTAVLNVTNMREQGINVIWVKPVPSLFDDKGNVLYLDDISGMSECRDDYSGTRWFNEEPKDCPKTNADYYTLLEPQQQAAASLLFRQWQNGRGDKALAGASATLAAVLQVWNGDSVENLSVSIPAIALGESLAQKSSTPKN